MFNSHLFINYSNCDSNNYIINDISTDLHHIDNDLSNICNTPVEKVRKISCYETEEMNENEMNRLYYKLFDYNDENDTILINGKIPNIIKPTKKLNELLYDNYDNSCSYINIPMIEKLYIKYKKEEITIDIKNFIYWHSNKTDNIYILPKRSNNIMTYQDIIINSSNGIISINIYKLNKNINDITYGIILLYKSFSPSSIQPSSIFFTKESYNKSNSKKQNYHSQLY